MKKKIKPLFCIILLATLFAVFFPQTALADDAFVITDYDVHTVITEGNEYFITETITVDFSEAKHGIYRTIPVNQEFARVDEYGTGFTTKVPSSVWDVNVEGYNYSVSNSSNAVTIKIGDPDKTVTGKQVYKITYKLVFGDDGVKSFDEVYYNIIGNDWPTTINQLTFSVTLPKPFDEKKLGFSMGTAGTSGYDPDIFSHKVDGNTVTGRVLGQLLPYTAVTMREELPQGYFKIPDIRIPDWILMGVIGAITLIAIILFLMFGRDKKPVKTVEFEAPDGMTPPEVAYVYSGILDNSDIVSLLIYWADKGYLKIQQEGGSCKLEKIRDMGEEAREFEMHMFNRLFKKDPVVYTDELKHHFYSTIQSVHSKIVTFFEKDDTRIFTKKSLGIGHRISFLLMLPIIIALSFAMTRAELGLIFAVFMGIVVGIPLLFPFLFFVSVLRYWQTTAPKSRGIRLIFATILSAGFFTIFLLLALDNANEPLLPWTAILATFILGLCSAFIRKRTPKGVEWLGKIMGLKEFIILAEQDRLKMLVEQNPNYFYHILPYAFVLKITDQWVKNFESIAVPPPDWYTGQDTAFSAGMFMSSISGAMTTFEYHMSSSPASSRSGSGSSGGSGGGSGFSGGSSSGGGGGGGGGGSW